MADVIEIQGLDELLKGLRSLSGRGLRTAIRRASQAIGEEVKGRMMRYPPRRYGVKAVFASRKQRGFFFAALREGRIEVPYRRGQSPGSQDLKNKWVVQARDDGAVVGTPVGYAPLVQSAREQTEMHRGTGWVTDEQVVAEVSKSDISERIVVAAVLNEVEKRLR